MLQITVYRVAILFLILVVSLVNVRLYVPLADDDFVVSLPPDAIQQMNFLRHTLENGAGEQMQAIFPEGFFFSHVLYGLAWIQVGLRSQNARERAITEAQWALDQLTSPQGRAAFSSNLNPPYGVFYAGWSNWLRGGILRVQPSTQWDPRMVGRYQTESRELNMAFQAAIHQQQTPFLMAYPGQAWPVDSVVAIAALRLYDQLFPPEFETTITQWIQLAQHKRDPQTGLLPHQVDPQTGEALDTARGSSQSIIQHFLPDIDPAWAKADYAAFRREFVGSLLSIPGIREYPEGISGSGDVDSGPLVCGLSASATVVTLGAAHIHGDRELAGAFRQLGESAGLPLSWGDTKRYLLGILPIGDTFLVWSQTAYPLVATPVSAQPFPAVIAPGWRLVIHGVTAIIMLILLIPELLYRRKRRRTR